MRHTTLANVLLRNAFGFMDGKGRGAVRAQMAKENKPLYTGAGSNLRQCARALDVGFEQVALPSLGCRAGEVIYLVRTAQGSPYTAFIVQANYGHFHGYPFWQSR